MGRRRRRRRRSWRLSRPASDASELGRTYLPTQTRKRENRPKAVDVAIWRRDGCLCCWCKRPVIFSPAIKFLELELRSAGHTGPPAYYHRNGTRDGSPLLDELGACIDRGQSFSAGGECREDNLRTSCWKCNTRKNSAPMAEWDQRHKNKPVKGSTGNRSTGTG